MSSGSVLCLWTLRPLVPVPLGVPALPGSDPAVGGVGPSESADQRGSPLWLAACYSSHVHQQVQTTSTADLIQTFKAEQKVLTSASLLFCVHSVFQRSWAFL